MKTEEVTRQSRPGAQVVSRALEDLGFLSAEVINDRGYKVPLSTAGYVLHTGRKYRLRLLTPEDGDVSGVQSSGSTDILTVDSPFETRDEDNRQVHEISFRVKRDLGSAVFRPVWCDEIEVNLQFRPESGKRAPCVSYPVVVRPGLGLATLGFLASLASIVTPVLLRRETVAGWDFWSHLGEWLEDPLLWLILVAFLIFPVFVYGNSLWQLGRRGRELRRQFEDKYLSPGLHFLKNP
jgi:hypothetical protein